MTENEGTQSYILSNCKYLDNVVNETKTSINSEIVNIAKVAFLKYYINVLNVAVLLGRVKIFYCGNKSTNEANELNISCMLNYMSMISVID
jgi:hypothetical protein